MSDERYNMPITSFREQYRWLSNFWPAEVQFDAATYPSVEHAYQAAKTLDPAERETVRRCPRAGDAKRLGRALRLRPDWERVRLGIMEDLVRSKFYDNDDLRARLLATGDRELVEGNNWGDRFWGVCDGRGENHLGRILMRVRAELQEDRDRG